MKWSFESSDASGAYSIRSDLLDYLQARATPDSDLEAAALVFGELVGNVVRHAPGPIAVDLYWDGGYAVLRVRDRGPGFDWNGSAVLPAMLSECGRGLFIAHCVARSLRVCRYDGGTEATAWLPVAWNAREMSA